MTSPTFTATPSLGRVTRRMVDVPTAVARTSVSRRNPCADDPKQLRARNFGSVHRRVPLPGRQPRRFLVSEASEVPRSPLFLHKATVIAPTPQIRALAPIEGFP